MWVWWTHLQAFPAQLYLPLGSLTSTVAHLFCLILSCKPRSELMQTHALPPQQGISSS